MLGNRRGVKLKEKNKFKDFRTGKLEKLLKKDTTQKEVNQSTILCCLQT